MPYNVVFVKDRNLLVLDIIVEILFSIGTIHLLCCPKLLKIFSNVDIVLNFRTTYVDKAGHVVYKPGQIAKNYLTGWFVLDLFAALPFDAMSIHANFVRVVNFNIFLWLVRILELQTSSEI